MNTITRYAAKLLFQYRVVVDENSGKRRTCEERIIVFKCHSNEEAWKKAIDRGNKEEFNYKNDDGNEVFFEFIGIIDLISLGAESDEDEVWYDVKEYLLPMERKKDILPDKHALSIFLKT